MSEIKILYVEDSDFDAFYYKTKIEQSEHCSFKVRVVGDLESAKAAIAEKLRYDLVLLDLNLPDSTGLDTLSAIKETKTVLPIVVLSSTGDKEMFAEATRLGASGYIVKKADDYDVAEHLVSVVKKHREAVQRRSINHTLGNSEEKCGGSV